MTSIFFFAVYDNLQQYNSNKKKVSFVLNETRNSVIAKIIIVIKLIKLIYLSLPSCPAAMTTGV